MGAPRTPGPWAYLDIGEIVSTDPVDDYPTDDVICVVAGPEHPNADGNLIAAAPELYEALEELLESYLDALPGSEDYAPVLEAQAALAKARGEQ